MRRNICDTRATGGVRGERDGGLRCQRQYTGRGGGGVLREHRFGIETDDIVNNTAKCQVNAVYGWC